MRLLGLFLLGLGLACGAGCADGKDKMKEAQRKRDAEKKRQADEAEAKRKALGPKANRAQLGAPWDDPSYAVVTIGRPCPEGLWALFKETPGEGAEQEANEKKRADYLKALEGKTFVALLPMNTGLTLRPYNAKKKTLTVEVDGAMECYDKAGLLSLAWGEPAKPFRPKKPDEDDEEPMSPQSVWRAQPLLFPLPFATAAEAKAFAQGDGLTLEARLVFTLGKVDTDTKVVKVSPNGEEVPQEVDYGAGRLVHVKLKGVRLSTNFEKVMHVEKLTP